MKHEWAIRVIMKHEPFQMMRTMFLYESDSSVLTLDDLLKINTHPQYELAYYFYIGPQGSHKKYDMSFNLFD